MTKEGNPFTRELRYIVVKCSDAAKYLSTQERTALETISARCQLGRIHNRKKLLETVVVESDWPEYEPTWKAIEERMQPTPPPPAGAGTEPAKYDAPELEILSRDRQIAYLRHQAKQLEATVAELVRIKDSLVKDCRDNKAEADYLRAQLAAMSTPPTTKEGKGET